MGINTIIFDFDGTVADTNQVIINSWQHTYKTVLGHEESEEKIISSFGEPLALTMAKVFPGKDVDEMVEIYRSYQVNHFTDMIRPFKGMDKLIIDLKEKNYKVGIVTSRMLRTTVEGLKAFGIYDYIDHIVSCEDTNKHKPDPEPINLALEKFKVSKEDALMIGDSMFDILCAHNAGVKAVLVSWAVAVTEEDLKGPNRPEYIIEEAEELFNIV